MASSLLKFAVVAFLGVAVAGCSTTGSNTVTSGAPVTSASSLVTPAAYSPPSAESAVAKRAKPYFAEFRARSALSYGHTFLVFGKLDENGRVPVDANGVLIPSMTEITGLAPASTSSIPYTIGHVLPVPAETGPSDGDNENAYMTAYYRIDLTEAQYRGLVAYVRKLKASRPVWHAVLYNCSAYTNDIAKYLGLKTVNPLLFPKNYINALKRANS